MKLGRHMRLDLINRRAKSRANQMITSSPIEERSRGRRSCWRPRKSTKVRRAVVAEPLVVARIGNNERVGNFLGYRRAKFDAWGLSSSGVTGGTPRKSRKPPRKWNGGKCCDGCRGRTAGRRRLKPRMLLAGLKIYRLAKSRLGRRRIEQIFATSSAKTKLCCPCLAMWLINNKPRCHEPKVFGYALEVGRKCLHS